MGGSSVLGPAPPVSLPPSGRSLPGEGASLASGFSVEPPALGSAGLCPETRGGGGGTATPPCSQWQSWGSPRPHSVPAADLSSPRQTNRVQGSWRACGLGPPPLDWVAIPVSPRSSLAAVETELGLDGRGQPHPASVRAGGTQGPRDPGTAFMVPFCQL